ncbi:hypothetical protein [Nocardia pseudobrasiliensis]|uniref:Secreted protein n=1 Tax=Nocardia pseudobrasiliensis TaxID=45979 RepID=A0A370HXV7_9NOCA|nr:hypothetical protein [Nocardia pseudobrasiliensis]RDI63343.1 hypothetical protein DFR76_11040 [Nocardia pseudobrasiliensis]
MRKRFAVALSAVIGGTLLSMATPAHSTPTGGVHLECSGHFDVSFSPALTTVAKPTTITETDHYDACSTGASAGEITRSFTITVSCADWATTKPPGTEVIRWIGGIGERSSTVHYSSAAPTDQGASYRGEVLAGRFRGDNSQKQFTPTAFAPPAAAKCEPGSAVRAAAGGIRLLLTDAER